MATNIIIANYCYYISVIYVQKNLYDSQSYCKDDMSQHSKTVKMVLGRNYRALNSRLAFARRAILNTWKILLYTKLNFGFLSVNLPAPELTVRFMVMGQV